MADEPPKTALEQALEERAAMAALVPAQQDALAEHAALAVAASPLLRAGRYALALPPLPAGDEPQ